MNARVLALAVVMALVPALAVQAQDDDEEEEYYYEKETSGYMELYGAGGYFVINEDDKGSGGLGVTIGGHITEHIAMDLTWEFQSSSTTNIGTYALKYVFLTGRVQPYVKAGLGAMLGRPDHSFLFVGRFDAGVTYFLDEQLAVTGGAGYAVARSDNNLFLGKLGLTYYFE